MLRVRFDHHGVYAFFPMDTGEIAVAHSIRSEKAYARCMRWTTEGVISLMQR